jgi:tetratricopeptide (TPR) repeat protein
MTTGGTLKSMVRVGVSIACCFLIFACVKTERDYQMEHAQTLTPKQLGTSTASDGIAKPIAPQPPRVFTIRAWVDLDYQSQSLHWTERVRTQVERASELTASSLNVEIKLVSIESWNHRAENSSLESQLNELEQQDSARDVDLVLGFVSSLQIFTESQDKLGLARFPGHHAVLRSMDNAAEHDAIVKVFTTFDANEKDNLYRERKLHKETSLLIHEWAHSLGAPHDSFGDSLVNPIYEVQRNRIPPATAALLARSLELRDAKVDRKKWAKELSVTIREAPAGSWNLKDVERTLENLERIVQGEDQHAARLENAKVRSLFNDVVRLQSQGKAQEALTALEPLIQRQPPIAAALALACMLAGQVGLSNPQAKVNCQRAASLSPEDGGVLLMLAQIQLTTKDAPTARQTFIKARKQLMSTPSVAVETTVALTEVAKVLHFVTWAEQGALKTQGRSSSEKINEWATKERRWFGLMPDVAIAPEVEPEYIARIIEIQNNLGSNKLTAAEPAIFLMENQYPQLAGALTLRCEFFLRRAQFPKAIESCELALAKYPDSLQAHYLLGVLFSSQKQHHKAIAHLEKVVAFDDTVSDAWDRLSESYVVLGDKKNIDRVIKHLAKDR